MELISNFNNLSDFSHSSTFQTRVYFFFKTVQKSYLLKITVFIETAFIAFMYIHDYVFFSLCVCECLVTDINICRQKSVFNSLWGFNITKDLVLNISPTVHTSENHLSHDVVTA